ncbi:MAG: hypothetical protein GY710_00910 [Desulfobacteraceae bacterium]|nr:hypothetical protein [Desulfobacteraceae bacterium]
MNQKTLLLSVISIFTLSVLFAGCAGKIPQSTMNNNSALSISAGLNARASFLTKESINTTNVFFIRLDDENDSLQKQKVITSNYNKTPLMVGFQMDNIDSFCLNLEPGIYAAVAAKGVGANSNVKYYIYFPEEMIKKTIVNLKQNSMRYLGEFDFEDVSYKNQMNNPDKVQFYYFASGLIDGVPGTSKPRYISNFITPQHHSPSLEKFANSKEKEVKFLNSVSGSFKNTGWYDNIKARLDTLGK